MFACIRRFRRSVAVLAAVTLLAGVLAAAPVVADEHPEQNYLPAFSACDGAPSSGFEDVPMNHANAGDIDCIAYYGITRGTTDTTYSPLMSVTREHMALFLTRLAARVGIELASDPADAGFTDIGDLSDESQTAIAQLADAGITRGTSSTTYSPSDSVTRGHMALFISRLMDHMDPFADPGAADDAPAFAYIPKEVVAVADNASTPDKDETIKVGSPFTDLGSATKSAYDAITALWELGVASGISDTAYAPAASITRAAMADFMAGVLDHSNARPTGVTMQVNKTTGFGEVEATRAISVRDDNFAPIGDVSVKVFTATESGGFDDDGKCIASGMPCEWSDNDEITNDHGNHFDTIVIATVDGDGDPGGNMEKSETWYAWMGSEDNPDFVVGESGEAMVTLTAMADALGIRVTTDINEHATGSQVDVGKDRTVVITAQLVDEASDSTTIADANPVAKENVKLSISWSLDDDGPGTGDAVSVYPPPEPMKTDADGKVMFTIEGPADPDDDTPVMRDEKVSFTGDVDGDTNNEMGEVTVQWRNDDPAVDKGMASAPNYVIIDDDGMVRIVVMVSYYDQYGNPAGSGDHLTITVGDTSVEDMGDSDEVRVKSNGTARFIANIKANAEEEKAVTVTALATAGTTATAVEAVLAVRHAKDNGGVSSTAENFRTDTDNDRFIIGGVLYSYDSGDVFIIESKEVDMAAFEEYIKKEGAGVNVVFYSVDGTSIFTDGGGGDADM